MKTICVAARKGGSGKTSLVRNLAVAATEDGWKVLMIDLDPLQGLRAWWQGRQSDTPVMLTRDPPPGDLAATFQVARAHFDLAMIDTPPGTAMVLRDVLRLADLALVPVRPSPDDLRALDATISDLRDAQLPCAFVLSQDDRGELSDDVLRALALMGPVVPTRITLREAHVAAAAAGQGVTETDDAEASAELTAIWTHVRRAIA